MKIYILSVLACVCLFINSCGTCGDCAKWVPFAHMQPVVEFDTLGLLGFAEGELDSIFVYRYNDSMRVIDTVFRRISRDQAGRLQAVLYGHVFDGFGFRQIARFYELEIRGQSKTYMFRDFDFRVVPKPSHNRCGCDGSVLQSVRVNDSFVNIAAAPFRIHK